MPDPPSCFLWLNQALGVSASPQSRCLIHQVEERPPSPVCSRPMPAPARSLQTSPPAAASHRRGPGFSPGASHLKGPGSPWQSCQQLWDQCASFHSVPPACRVPSQLSCHLLTRDGAGGRIAVDLLAPHQLLVQVDHLGEVVVGLQDFRWKRQEGRCRAKGTWGLGWERGALTAPQPQAVGSVVLSRLLAPGPCSLRLAPHLRRPPRPLRCPSVPGTLLPPGVHTGSAWDASGLGGLGPIAFRSSPRGTSGVLPYPTPCLLPPSSKQPPLPDKLPDKLGVWPGHHCFPSLGHSASSRLWATSTWLYPKGRSAWDRLGPHTMASLGARAKATWALRILMGEARCLARQALRGLCHSTRGGNTTRPLPRGSG